MYWNLPAAWKASAKKWRYSRGVLLEHFERQFAQREAAEKRVAELEGALIYLDTAIMPEERKYDRNGWCQMHKQTLREFDNRVKIALNK